jgi:tRNA nucleotidyltransferase (CCA-adding enzyme)
LEVESTAPAPLLLGRHLLAMGLQPGPRVGEIARAVYEMQLDGRVRDLDEAKEFAKKFMSTDYTDYTDYTDRTNQTAEDWKTMK